jgi:TDG/mug DNA glycosylase family protein
MATKLPNVLGPGLDVVFCGTAAGDRSAAFGCYYAGPGNKFYLAQRAYRAIARSVAALRFQAIAVGSWGAE